jgi:SOS response regulatory protein OraA/RecX
MAKEWLTDAEVESEIERLREDPNVRLARKELRIQYRRRQALYQLRNLEKRGKELAKLGYTYDNIEDIMLGSDIEDDYAE